MGLPMANAMRKLSWEKKTMSFVADGELVFVLASN